MNVSPEMLCECAVIDCSTSRQGIEDSFLRIIAQQRQPVVEDQLRIHLHEQADLNYKLTQMPRTILDKLQSVQGAIMSDAGLVESLEALAQSREDLSTKLDSREEKIELANQVCEPYRPLAKRCLLLYTIALKLKSIDPLYEYSLEGFKTALIGAAAQDGNRPARGYIHVPAFTRAAHGPNPFMRCRVMATVVKICTKRLLDRGRLVEASAEDADPDTAVKDNDKLFPTVTLRLCHFVQKGLFSRDKLLFVAVVALRTMIETGAVSPKEIQTMTELGKASGGAPLESKFASKMPAIVASFMPERSWNFLCALEEIPGLQKLSQDVEAVHERWQRWSSDARPETMTLPSVYGRTASAFHKLLILRAVRPDRVQHGFQLFVSENLGREFVTDAHVPLIDMFRVSRPRMPLLFFATAGTEDCSSQLATLIRKKNFGGRVAYMRHGKVRDEDVRGDMTRAMRAGRWLIMYEAESNPLWLQILDQLLQSSNLYIDGDFRAFIMYNSAVKRVKFSMPDTLIKASICITHEAPKGFRSHVLKSLSVFDNEQYNRAVLNRMPSKNSDMMAQDNVAKQKRLENMATALAICHANMTYRNRFPGLGWTREANFTLDHLQEAGQSLLRFLTGPATPNAKLISNLSESIYGAQMEEESDLRLVRQTVYDLLHRENFKKAELLPGMRAKDEMTYGEYMEYITGSEHLEDTNVVGLHSNASIFVSLPEADSFLDSLNAVLSPQSSLDSGQKSVAAASDSLHELIEQLPINFNTESIRDDVQKLGAQREPLGYMLLHEATRLNVVFDTVRREMLALQSAMKGLCNMSDQMEELLAAIRCNQVPPGWLAVGRLSENRVDSTSYLLRRMLAEQLLIHSNPCNISAHDARFGLSRWFIDLLQRVDFIEAWKVLSCFSFFVCGRTPLAIAFSCQTV
jgi:dynein heavy chain